MKNLPKPSKVIDYKGLKVPLYQSPTLLKMIGKKRDTFLKWEADGVIPTPLFLNGTRRYYMKFELQALADVISSHGIPRMEVGKENEFSKDLKAKWQLIRSYVLNGKYPPQPLRLQFDNRETYIKAMREVMGIYGLRGEVQAEAIAEELLRKAQVF